MAYRSKKHPTPFLLAMPLFGRRTHSPNGNGKLLNIGGNERGDGAVGPPFRAGAWLRLHGFDVLTMAVMGAIGLGVYFASMIGLTIFMGKYLISNSQNLRQHARSLSTSKMGKLYTLSSLIHFGRKSYLFGLRRSSHSLSHSCFSPCFKFADGVSMIGSQRISVYFEVGFFKRFRDIINAHILSIQVWLRLLFSRSSSSG
jgi:hypothetical protein